MIVQQLDLDMLNRSPAKPRDLLAAALAWIEAHPCTWQGIVEAAERDANRSGRVRIKGYIENLRVSGITRIPNSYSAPFGRILAAWHPDLEPYIPLAVSKVDGMSIPPRPY